MTFREQTIAKYRKYRAALILLNAVRPIDRPGMDATLRGLSGLSTGQLRVHADKIDAVYHETMKKYGVRASLDELEAMLADERDDTTTGALKIIPKFVLATYFQHYEGVSGLR